MTDRCSTVLFASAVPKSMDRNKTLPALFQRMLKKLPIRERVKGRTVAIKMHLGGGLGYSTIHPLFVRLLVEHVREGGARDVFVTDSYIDHPERRGYTAETIGAPMADAFGSDGKDTVTKATGWEPVPEVQLSRPVVEAEVLINLSHVKGHGDCGFGAACKNLAMGCVPRVTRGRLHALEGNLKWDRSKCILCRKCLDECSTHANSFDSKGEYTIFWHNCRMCQHCALICPTGSISMEDPKFDKFQEGLARTTDLVIRQFKPGMVFHINVLTSITIFCDCWGLTTPSLVPDIGIMASEDIVAVDRATLDAVKVENLIPGSITPPFTLGEGSHLFERLHGRNPYIQNDAMAKLGTGSTAYKLVEIE